jgi:sigma-B regulation protein RsbU (phosphoserine phosphatase)
MNMGGSNGVKLTSIKAKLKFLLLYVAIGLGGTLVVTSNNVLINGKSLVYLLEFNLKFVLMQALVFTLIFQTITHLKLRKVFRYIDGADVDQNEVRSDSLKFPMQLYVWFIFVGIGLAIAFAVGQALYYGRFMDSRYWLLHTKSLLYETGLILLICLILYTYAKRILKPVLISLPPLSELTGTRASLTFRITGLAVILSFQVIIVWGWIYVRSVYFDAPPSFGYLIGNSLVMLGYNTWMAYMIVSDMTDDLRLLTRRFQEIDEQSKPEEFHTPLAVASADEIGDLQIAYNQLQGRINKFYSGLMEEIQLAHHVQHNLLPRSVALPEGLEMGVTFHSAKEVGGDFYDVIVLDENRTLFVIGDVVGKGLPAALIMSAAVAIIRSEAYSQKSIPQILQQLNRIMGHTLIQGMHISLCLCLMDQKRKTLSGINAGHVLPYIWREGKVTELPLPSTFPIGIDPDLNFEEHVVGIQEKDMVIFYTDGLVEARSKDKEMFGFDRLQELLGRLNPVNRTQEEVRQIFDQIGRFRGSDTLEDDTSLIIVKIKSCKDSVRVTA